MLSPDDRVVVYMRPGCHVCARVKDFLTRHEVPYEARDVDRDPLTPRELWELFNRKADRLRVPFTALNDGADVVLGYDPQRLEGVFVHGELGGVQVSTPVDGPVVYDEFTSSALDEARWHTEPPAGDTPLPASARRIETGHGQLRLGAPIRLVSADRFATPPGSHVTAELDAAVEVTGPVTGSMSPPIGEVALHDRPTGVVLGFELTAATILAVHKRLGAAGVSAEAERFTHRVLTDVATAAGRSHRFRITYEHDTATAGWYVDGRPVYVATTPLRIEGISLSMGLHGDMGLHDDMGLHGDGAAARFTPWQLRTAD